MYWLTNATTTEAVCPNVDVFGPAIPLPGRDNPAFCVSDLACKLLVRLKNESPEVLDDTQVALGKLHGKIVLFCLLPSLFYILPFLGFTPLMPIRAEFAHPSCRKANTLRNKPGSGVIDGEVVERYWNSVGGAAVHAEKQNVSHFAETFGDIFGLENAKAIVSIPSLLARKAQRACSAFVMNLQQLVDYTVEIGTSYGVIVTGESIKAWADKIDANPSGDPAAYLRVEAQLYGALDELEAKRNVLSSLTRAQLFGSVEEADLIKKTKRKIVGLEKRARVLQLQAGIDYQPCSEDGAEFRQATVVHLTTQVIDLEARMLIAQGSVQRGKNSMRILHAKEKIANRKTVERLRLSLEEVQAKLVLNFSMMSPSSEASIDSEDGLPIIVRLDCYIRTCLERAGALHAAAADLDLSTRLGLGKRALFKQRASFFEAMAKNGTEVGT